MFRSKYKNVAYGVTVNPNEKISQRGLCFIILEEGDNYVEGIKLIANGNVNFSMLKTEIDALIHSKELVFIETLPKNIAQEMYAVFKANKLQQNLPVV